MASTSIQAIAWRSVQWIRDKVDPLREMEVQEEAIAEIASPPPSPESHLKPETVERTLFPSPPEMESPDGSEVLDGSLYIFPTKTRISPESEKRVAEELKDAMSREFFPPLWPYIQEKQPSKGGNYETERRAKAKRDDDEMAQSAAFRPKLAQDKRERKAQIMKKWKAMKDRPPSRPATGFGSLEDDEIKRRLEDLNMFEPTLYPNLQSRSPNRQSTENGKDLKHGFRKQTGDLRLLEERRLPAEGSKDPRQQITKDTHKQTLLKLEHEEKIPQKHSHQTYKSRQKDIFQAPGEPECQAPQRFEHLRVPRYRYKDQDSDDELPFAPGK